MADRARSQSPPRFTLPAGISPDRFAELVRLAREEDLGEAGDVTTRLAGLAGEAQADIVARQPGLFCGAELLPALLAALAPEVTVASGPSCPALQVAAGQGVARLAGPVRQLLEAERTLLNFLQRLSGVATLTRRFVEAVAGTAARVYDTRKTVPGWRDLDKYAVRCGGGHNHRHGLHDAVLVKDNHLAGVPTERLAYVLFEMLNGLQQLEAAPEFVEVEVDNLAQLGELLKVVGINVVLLDNFSPAQLRQAVQVRDAAGLKSKVELEASGGVTLENVRAIAETGVERISVGAITHSPPAFNLALELLPNR